MNDLVTIAGGFAETDAGSWLTGRGQPVAYFGEVVRRRRKGWLLRDRGVLELAETSGAARFADAARPFLTHIPCAAPVNAVSSKVLLAPASARTGAETVRLVPMSVRGAIGVTVFGSGWVVMATASRTARVSVEDGDTLSVRPEAVVAWTGNRPTGFVRRLGLWDILLPRQPRDMMLHFHGPCVVWLEGAKPESLASKMQRRVYGV
jgi:uncharacterized protein (AIM24 family)